MKKIFTLIALAAMAMSVNAQDKWSAEDLSFEKRTYGSKGTRLYCLSMSESDNKGASYLIPSSAYVFPAGTYAERTERLPAWIAANDGSQYAVTLKDYQFSVEKTNVTLTAIATPNADAEEFERWQPTGELSKWQQEADEDKAPETTNVALSTEDCDPKWPYYVKPKNGNPSLGYYDYYEYPAEKTTDPETGQEVDKRDENGEIITDNTGTPIHRVSDVIWKRGDAYPPGKGCYYQFDIKANGKLKVGVYLTRPNSNETLVVEKSTLTPLEISKLSFVGFCQNNGYTYNEKTYQEFAFRDDYTIDVSLQQGRPLLGYLSFPVEANKSYLLFQPSTQIGIYGFHFIGADGIESINASAQDTNEAIYNLAGQKVDKSFKGIVIQNGKKFFSK